MSITDSGDHKEITVTAVAGDVTGNLKRDAHNSYGASACIIPTAWITKLIRKTNRSGCGRHGISGVTYLKPNIIGEGNGKEKNTQ